jgi:catechol 2,3-dioxygenase-like lactoylglutathione lyase family enzyme
MKIKLTSVYVNDQDKALRFYTEVLGFAKKADFSNGPFRWLTVVSPEEPDGTELQLALNNNPAAKAYQQTIFQQSQPAAMFFTDDVKGDYERILRQPHSAHPAGTLLRFRSGQPRIQISDRDSIAPSPRGRGRTT